METDGIVQKPRYLNAARSHLENVRPNVMQELYKTTELAKAHSSEHRRFLTQYCYQLLLTGNPELNTQVEESMSNRLMNDEFTVQGILGHLAADRHRHASSAAIEMIAYSACSLHPINGMRLLYTVTSHADVSDELISSLEKYGHDELQGSIIHRNMADTGVEYNGKDTPAIGSRPYWGVTTPYKPRSAEEIKSHTLFTTKDEDGLAQTWRRAKKSLTASHLFGYEDINHLQKMHNAYASQINSGNPGVRFRSRHWADMVYHVWGMLQDGYPRLYDLDILSPRDLPSFGNRLIYQTGVILKRFRYFASGSNLQ